MNKVYLGIRFALSYFTFLPVRFGAKDDLSDPRVMESMLLFLPLVGVILAALTVGVAEAFQSLGWLGALIAAALYMIAYGFIHTEAVIDVADALYAAHSGKDPYAVIKEPYTGAMGVLYGAVFVLLKTASLAYLLLHHLYLPFVMIAMTSRLNLLLLIRWFTFRSSFVTTLRSSLRIVPLWLAVLAYGAAGSAVLGGSFLLITLLGLGISLAVFALIRRSLGFGNGDVLGCSLELTELLLILSVLLAWL